ncbi:MAG TPA: arginase family protein [Candidatus Lumbricidophila sp.]|nr:arginase family protein [Candidatus Lumbricidophila sp.]
MAATFFVVPVWHGSISERAMRLADGAEAIMGDLPSGATHRVEVPTGAGEALGTAVRRFSSLHTVKQRTEDALLPHAERVIVIGGDCSATIGALQHAADRTDGDLAVLWFDAQPDLNTPESSPSGAFGGMVLRAALGDAPTGLAIRTPQLTPGQVVLCGARAFDAEESRYIAEHGIPVVGADAPNLGDALVAAIRATGRTRVYVHIDLDVLDTAALNGLANPLPFGLPAATLVSAIRSVGVEFDIVGASVCGFAPASPVDATDDLPTVLRILGALAA